MSKPEITVLIETDDIFALKDMRRFFNEGLEEYKYRVKEIKNYSYVDHDKFNHGMRVSTDKDMPLDKVLEKAYSYNGGMYKSMDIFIETKNTISSDRYTIEENYLAEKLSGIDNLFHGDFDSIYELMALMDIEYSLDYAYFQEGNRFKEVDLVTFYNNGDAGLKALKLDDEYLGYYYRVNTKFDMQMHWVSEKAHRKAFMHILEFCDVTRGYLQVEEENFEAFKEDAKKNLLIFNPIRNSIQ